MIGHAQPVIAMKRSLDVQRYIMRDQCAFVAQQIAMRLQASNDFTGVYYSSGGKMTHRLGYFSLPSLPSNVFFKRLCLASAHCTICAAPQNPNIAAGKLCVATANRTQPQISNV